MGAARAAAEIGALAGGGGGGYENDGGASGGWGGGGGGGGGGPVHWLSSSMEAYLSGRSDAAPRGGDGGMHSRIAGGGGGRASFVSLPVAAPQWPSDGGDDAAAPRRPAPRRAVSPTTEALARSLAHIQALRATVATGDAAPVEAVRGGHYAPSTVAVAAAAAAVSGGGRDGGMHSRLAGGSGGGGGGGDVFGYAAPHAGGGGGGGPRYGGAGTAGTVTPARAGGGDTDLEARRRAVAERLLALSEPRRQQPRTAV